VIVLDAVHRHSLPWFLEEKDFGACDDLRIGADEVLADDDAEIFQRKLLLALLGQSVHLHDIAARSCVNSRG
jgi:hypothetical protein